MSDLTPANEALMATNPRSTVGRILGLPFTPTRDQILSFIAKATDALVLYEEYDHPVLSRIEARARVMIDLDLGLRALKADAITALKTARGEWIAHA